MKLRQILADELRCRQAKNLNYSGRALARDLGVSQSLLSQILAKDQSVSTKLGLRILSRFVFSSFSNSNSSEVIVRIKSETSLSKQMKRPSPLSGASEVINGEVIIYANAGQIRVIQMALHCFAEEMLAL